MPTEPLISEPSLRRPSAVSQLLRAMQMDAVGDGRPARPKEEDLRVRLACDHASKERALDLAWHAYRARGYAGGEGPYCMATPYDTLEETAVFLAEDCRGRSLATVSLVYDGKIGLPCDYVFGADLAGLRAQGRKLAEVVRLAIRDECRNNRMLLVRLFNAVFVHARMLSGADDLVIEVNPRHVASYAHMLQFQEQGMERPCPRVGGAPAVLMRLDLDVGERLVRHMAGKPAARTRLVYPHFFDRETEAAFAESIRSDCACAAAG